MMHTGTKHGCLPPAYTTSFSTIVSTAGVGITSPGFGRAPRRVPVRPPAHAQPPTSTYYNPQPTHHCSYKPLPSVLATGVFQATALATPRWCMQARALQLGGQCCCQWAVDFTCKLQTESRAQQAAAAAMTAFDSTLIGLTSEQISGCALHLPNPLHSTLSRRAVAQQP
jgi:hypothetical protein